MQLSQFDNQPLPCKRPGCAFQRGYEEASNGSYRRQRHCSVACYVWCRRAAHVAKQSGPEADEEAAELLRLSDLLDARPDRFEPVPGVHGGTRRS